MSISRKYGRTFHYDFSPGTTSDDRINRNWREEIKEFEKVVHTEKLDGENTCLSEFGVFARSHAAPTLHPWADHLKIKQSMMVHDLKSMNLEIFGENLYALHSIIYPRLEHHFYVFGVRILDKWLSWEETKWYAEMFDFPVAPELGFQLTTDPELVKQEVLRLAAEESVFGSIQNNTNPPRPCTREGLVSRNINEYDVDSFAQNVFKFVRKDHVQTDVHWSKQITRARLVHEGVKKALPVQGIWFVGTKVRYKGENGVVVEDGNCIRWDTNKEFDGEDWTGGNVDDIEILPQDHEFKYINNNGEWEKKK